MRAISFALITGFWLLVAACASLSPPSEQPKALQLEAATECEARFSDIRVKEIDYYGRLSFEYGAPGGINYRDDFIACYQQRVQEKFKSLISSGRLSPSTGARAKTSVPIKVGGDKILVSVTINESQRATLLLDTGATHTILTPVLLGRLDIFVPASAPRWKVSLLGRESVAMPYARVRSLKVGEVAVEDIDVGVYDAFPNAQGVDGLLGVDFLNHFRVSIDRSSQRLTLEVITAIPQKGATDLLPLEPGWTLHEKPGEGFAIALPATWKPIDIDPTTLEVGFIRANEHHLQMVPFPERLLTRGPARFEDKPIGPARRDSIKFFGFDITPEAISSGFPARVSVVHQAFERELSASPAFSPLDRLVSLNTPNLYQSVPSYRSYRRVKLMIGEAEEVQWHTQVTIPTGKVLTLATTQYYLLKGKDAYVISLTTTLDQAAKYAPVFTKIGQSFGWVQ